MNESQKNSPKKERRKRLLIRGFLMMVVLLSVFFYYYDESGLSLSNTSDNEVEYFDIEEDTERIEKGIHLRTGFVDAVGMQEVINNCTNCHSAKLVTQNRMSKEGWIATIRWMQKTQNLWDLGDNESIIVDYLAEHYGPINKGRREGLKNIDWYTLK
ncbi:monoheme cytochrome C [Sediminicola sp. 1XM1-17]|uniref:monoheme cytochrome C n=1 Tax=Sediminicola sp. 1XM1-17 TaxID=3127702 RepID=UPI00307723DE